MTQLDSDSGLGDFDSPVFVKEEVITVLNIVQ
jgi:hypothetical protein